MRLTKRVREVGDSATLVMSARAKAMRAEGIDVVNLSAGEPDFPTPPHVVEAAQAFLATGQIKYTATPGIPELRQAAADHIAERSGIEADPEAVLIGNGGKHLLYTAMQALAEEGDEVLFASPYWVSYPEMARLACARPVPIPVSAESGFQLTAEDLDRHLTDRSRILVLNSPSNPTGARLTLTNLEAVVARALEAGLWILSDEIYDQLCYEGQFRSPIALGDAARSRTLAINSLSKTYSMTGWRVGYALGPKELIRAMTRIQAHETSNVNSLAQVAAVAALTGDQSCVAEQRTVFAQRRDLICQGLAEMPGIQADRPTGAFYVFPRVSDHYGKRIGDRRIEGSTDFCLALLEEAHVATVPGVAFGNDEHVRFSYANSTEQIQEGLRRLRSFLDRLD